MADDVTSKIVISREAILKQMAAEIPHLRRFARVFVRSSDAADDLTQETLLRATGAIEQFEPGTNLRAWLFTILRNTYLAEMRRHARNPVSNITDSVQVPTVSGRQEERHALRDLARGFGRLPRNQQEVVLLIVIEGMDYVDAARIMHVPVGTVRSRLSRAREALRQSVMGEAPTGEGAMKIN